MELDGTRPMVDLGRAGTSTEVSLVEMEASSMDIWLGWREFEEDEDVDKDEDVAKRWRADSVDAPDAVWGLLTKRLGADGVRFCVRRDGVVVFCRKAALLVS